MDKLTKATRLLAAAAVVLDGRLQTERTLGYSRCSGGDFELLNAMIDFLIDTNALETCFEGTSDKLVDRVAELVFNGPSEK